MKTNYQIPVGWGLEDFSETTSDKQIGLVRSSKEQDDSKAYPYIKMDAINLDGSLNLDLATKVDASNPEIERYSLKKGDFLFNTRNSSELVGKTSVFSSNKSHWLYNNNIMRVRFKDYVDPYFMNLAFHHSFIKAQLEKAKNKTTSVCAIYDYQLSKVKVPLPPIEEQRRIAAILDKADAIRRKRKEAIRLTESLLRSAFLDMFGDPGTNPKNWTICTVKDIAELVTDGTHHTPKRTPEGIPLLSARNIKNGFIDTSESLDFIPEDEYQRLKKRYDPKIGDVLISCSGSVGRVAVVRDSQPFSMVRSVAVIRAKGELVLPDYLESLFHSSFLQASIARGSKKSSQANLFQGAIKELPVYIPPLPLQKKWSDLKAQLRAMIKIHHTGVEAKNVLFSSLLQRAFRGEL